MYGMKKTELRLVPNDAEWKNDFAREKSRIGNRLRDETARIEHVGSTAIPTVHAKPILDIAILCGTKGIEAVAEALTTLGYEYRGQFDDEDGHFYAVLDRENVRYCQAHIYPQTCEDWRIKLLFRDVLSRNTELAREYDEYKLRLAQTAADKSEYAEIKTRWVDDFIHKIIEAQESI